MLSINDINLLQAQNRGLKKQNQGLQEENKNLREAMRKDFCEHYVLGECSQLHHDNCIGRNQCIKDLEQENARLKEEIRLLKQTIKNKNFVKIAEDYDNLLKQKNNVMRKNIILFSTLQEIKEIAERELSLTDEDDELWEVFSEILQKIAQASRVRSVGVGLREQDEQDTETRLMRAQQDAECEVDNDDVYEVIGNRYENKELLEG